ncbi:MAG: MoxR family ATPase [Aeropyrum sp.]|nr:MoxR family ATPase [Aeropyrum sp.]MCE4616480.1 MoxR family ATPase [Aeropyrum sp.]
MSGSERIQDVIERKVREAYESVVLEKARGRVRDPERAVKVLEKDFKLVVDKRLVTLVYAAFLNGRPVLFEGPPGTGKTEIGEALLELWSGKKPFILPCSESYDEYKVIGDFHPQMAMKHGFNEESFIPRPLLAALILDTGVLVDEVRRSNEEFQNLLLDIVDKRRIIVPEIKRVFRARGTGFQVVMTSNPEDIAQNELSDAFLRRVIRVRFSYPSPHVEERIIRLKLDEKPLVGSEVMEIVMRVVDKLRSSTISHKPGTAEAVSWVRLAQAIARLKGRERVTIEDLAEAAESILVKRIDDEDVVVEVMGEYLSAKAL